MIVRPADLADLAEICAARRSTVPASAYRHFICQMAGGPAWVCLSPDGERLALGGLYLRGDDPAVAWFLAGPSCGKHLRGVVAQIRRVLAHVDRRLPQGVVSASAIGNEAGHRLSRVLGFEADGEVLVRIGAYRIWRLTNVGCGQGSVRRQR